MNRATWLLVTMVLAGAAAAAGLGTRAASDRPAGATEGSWDSYRVLATRNIFLRDRSRPAPPRPSGGEDVRSVGAASASNLVLTGIGQSGTIRVALLEDLRAETTVQAIAGEIIEGGCLVEVRMDGMVYERRGVTRQIGLGQDLSGQTMPGWAEAEPASQPASRSTLATSRPSDGASGSAGLSDIERRMRQRRARE
ncbi:MAG: hypothetical protein NTV86_20650 [Planctomycetota bacterium]|nr:hypothetical protein [Planctomycetota bacterium]